MDVRVANAAITACERAGQWQQALAIFQHLQDLGRADVAWHAWWLVEFLWHFLGGLKVGFETLPNSNGQWENEEKPMLKYLLLLVEASCPWHVSTCVLIHEQHPHSWNSTFRGHELERGNQCMRHLAVCRWPFGDFTENQASTEHCNSAADPPPSKMIKIGMRGTNGEHLQVSDFQHIFTPQERKMMQSNSLMSLDDWRSTSRETDSQQITNYCMMDQTLPGYVFCLYIRKKEKTTVPNHHLAKSFQRTQHYPALILCCIHCWFHVDAVPFCIKGKLQFSDYRLQRRVVTWHRKLVGLLRLMTWQNL